MTNWFYSLDNLTKSDPEIADLIKKELEREEFGLQMIPSENFVSFSVLEALGSILTNKYAEGYPRKRYYSGFEFEEYGGPVVRLPRRFEELKELVNKIPGPILLETSLWNELQPDEIPSFFKAEEEQRLLAGLGFQLTYTVSKRVYSKGRARVRPVIRIYAREAAFKGEAK